MTYKLPPPNFEEWFRESVGVSFDGAKQRGAWDLKLIAEAFEAGRAYAIAAIEAQGVPDGWQLVPKEPTPEMVGAWKSVDQQEKTSALYKAMLASAPPAPQAEELVLWKARALQAEAIVAKFMEPQASVVQQEPVAWICEEQTIGPDYAKKRLTFSKYYSDNPLHYKHTPLYTHPAPQAKPQPLSDEHVELVAKWLEKQMVSIPATGPMLAHALRHVGVHGITKE